MSTTVTYVANQYSVPAYQDTGYAQGAGNLSSYLIALATGSLTLSGGAFALTANANFGASFGLISAYFTSRTANAATAGAVRLANADNISFRDSTNSSNISLTLNSSNQFSLGADVILPAGNGFIVTSPDGTQKIRYGVDNDGQPTMEPL